MSDDTATLPDPATLPDTGRIEAFTFGDPTPVLDGRDILDYAETRWNGYYHEPPISMVGLAKSFRSSPHHSGAIYVKRNVLVSSYIPHPMLTKQDFSRWVLDYILFGNAYLERISSRLGKTLALKPALAKYTRRGIDTGQYFYAPQWYERHEFARGSIHHIQEPDPNQELYGIPEYLSGLSSAWLNESATLFRRKYYQNGAHAGFILYLTDPAHNEGDIDALREALKAAKGPGNFRNLFMYAPNGKKDGIQVIPIAEVAAKDDFFNMKNVSRDDILAAHRVPPHLMGIVPNNAVGFGSMIDAANVFQRNELTPIQERLSELNEWVGEPVINFKPYEITPDLPA